MFEMNPDIEIIEIIEQTTLTIREEAKTESVPERMGKIFSEILSFMDKKGIASTGAPFAYWHNMSSDSISKGIFDMECGFPISVLVEDKGRIKRSKLPGGRVITALHIGSYETLTETYEVVMAWIRKNGYQVEENMWETYLTNPAEEPDKSKWMTRIFLPMKKF